MKPTKKQEERLVRWINRERKWRISVKGTIRRLPGGIPNDACECVLARALGGKALLNGDGTWNVTPWRSEKLPKYVFDFEQRFDAGEFPNLVDATETPLRDEVAAYYEAKRK